MMIDINAFRRALLFESLRKLDIAHLKMFFVRVFCDHN